MFPVGPFYVKAVAARLRHVQRPGRRPARADDINRWLAEASCGRDWSRVRWRRRLPPTAFWKNTLHAGTLRGKVLIVP
ncbi:MAG: hypothetical protein U0736_18295 [Gemmataceae bacterium]